MIETMIEIFLTVLMWYFAPLPWLTTVFHILIKKNYWRATGVKTLLAIFFILIWFLLGYWLKLNYQSLFINQSSHSLALFFGILILIIVIVIEILSDRALGRKRILLSSELQKGEDKLITTGIYKFARHPRYVEHPLLFLGLGFIFGHTLLLWFALYLFISFTVAAYFEELELIKRYGEDYLAYKKKTPAFFIWKQY